MWKCFASMELEPAAEQRRAEAGATVFHSKWGLSSRDSEHVRHCQALLGWAVGRVALGRRGYVYAHG